MNEEIKLNKRQPTWNYILNDLALYSLMTKVIHSEEVTNQEKFDFMYQIELLQQENARLKDKIEKANVLTKRIKDDVWRRMADCYEDEDNYNGDFLNIEINSIDRLLELFKEN